MISGGIIPDTSLTPVGAMKPEGSLSPVGSISLVSSDAAASPAAANLNVLSSVRSNTLSSANLIDVSGGGGWGAPPLG